MRGRFYNRNASASSPEWRRMRERCQRSFTEPAPPILAHGIGGDGAQHWRIELDPDGEDMIAQTPDKPPYRVPTMAEIAAVPKDGPTHVSTFSGTGGSCCGFAMAGYRTLWANDCDPAAQACYRLNFPNTYLDTRPIQQIDPTDILRVTGLARGELGVFEGSPPCTAFSTAGKRDKGWKQTKEHAGVVQQNVENLFFEWLRLLEGLMPQAFMAENVAGLARGRAKGMHIEILRRMRALGYVTEARIVDAQWMGVPQTRARLIYVGVRGDLGRRPLFPVPFPWRYSVREALPHLYAQRLIHDTRGNARVRTFTDQPAPSITNAGAGASGGGAAGHFKVARDVSDEPAPAITTGGSEGGRAGGGQGPHFVVEPRVISDRGSSEKWIGGGTSGPEDVTDRPVPAILGGTARGVRSIGLQVVEEPRVIHREYRRARETRDHTDAPIRTIAASRWGHDQLTVQSHGPSYPQPAPSPAPYAFDRVDDTTEQQPLLDAPAPLDTRTAAEPPSPAITASQKGRGRVLSPETQAVRDRAQRRGLRAPDSGVAVQNASAPMHPFTDGDSPAPAIAAGRPADVRITRHGNVDPTNWQDRAKLADYAEADLVAKEGGALRFRGKYGFKEHARSLDEPVPAVCAEGFTAMDYEVVTGVALQSQGNARRWRDAEAPAPCVQTVTGGLPSVEVRLQSSGSKDDWRPGDEPSPAIATPTTLVEQADSRVGGGQANGEPCGIDTGKAADRVIRRKLTIPEVMALCAFPPDFQLTGSFTQQWARLGNSVPPVMARHLAAAIRDALEG